MKECFFTASRTLSDADKYAAKFSSSIKDGPKKDELEVPIAMLCLITTTVCFYCSFFMALSDSGSDVVLTWSCMRLLTIGVKGTRRRNATSELMHMLMYTKVMSFFSIIFERSNCRFITTSCRTCTKLLRKHTFLFAVRLFIPSYY